MSNRRNASILLLCGLSIILTPFLHGQEPLSLAKSETSQQPVDEEYNRLSAKVMTLVKQAESLRNEFRFDEADEIDAEMLKLCFHRDKRLKLVHKLKQERAKALLAGDSSEAREINQEADKLLAELRKHYDLSGGPKSESNEPLLVEAYLLGNLNVSVNDFIANLANVFQSARFSAASPNTVVVSGTEQEHAQIRALLRLINSAIGG